MIRPRIPRPRRILAGAHPVWLLNAGILAVVGLLAAGRVGAFGPVAAPRLHWYLIAIAVCITERYGINLRFTRGSHSFSLTDIPLTLALIFASGLDALAGMALGTFLALALRRLEPIKIVFNVGQFVLGTAIGLLVVHLVAGAHPAFGPRLWTGVFLASQLNGAVTILLIAAAMSIADGRMSLAALRGMFGMDAAVTLMNTSVALIAAVIVVAHPAALPLLGVPVLIALLGYQAYIREHERLGKVEFLYHANRDLAESPEIADAIEGLLRRAREAFRAELAEVVLTGVDDQAVLRTRLGGDDATERIETVDSGMLHCLQRLAGAHPVALAGEELAELEALAGGGELRNAMVAVLHGEERTIGAMVVANRVGLSRGFAADDVALFETLVANTTAALQFDRLEQAVTDLRTLQDQLHHQAYHDPLTGLANRALFTRSLDAALDSGSAVAVMFIDLDDFKGVNDTLGHAVGDQLLCATAARITGSVRGDALVARLGGDEFAILLTASADILETVATEIAARVVTTFDGQVAIGERTLSTRLSIGIATTRHSGVVTTDLLRDADVAMYEAKAEGKGRYAVFTEEMRDTALRHHTIREELRSAIDSGHLHLQYQPIVDMRDGAVSAVEALVRWNHPNRGRIPPSEFVPLAESTGLIVPLGRHVLREACRQAMEWSRDGAPPVRVQVNLSARELENPDLIDVVRGVLRTSGLPSERLVLEITETVLIRDAAAGGATLEALRDLGVGLALDDFGTGYSSLSYMRSLPLDSLKIAKEFIDGLAHSEEDRAFVRLIIELARLRGLRIVAEGIEDGEQLEILRALGCDYGQGYLFSRPIDGDDPSLRAALGVVDVTATTALAVAG